MAEPVNMNIKGKRRVLIVLDVQADYSKYSAEERRHNRENGYYQPSVEDEVEDTLEWVFHELKDIDEIKISKHSDYLLANKEGFFDDEAVDKMVLKVVRGWEKERWNSVNGRAKTPKTIETEETLYQGEPQKLPGMMGVDLKGGFSGFLGFMKKLVKAILIIFGAFIALFLFFLLVSD